MSGTCYFPEALVELWPDQHGLFPGRQLALANHLALLFPYVCHTEGELVKLPLARVLDDSLLLEFVFI